MAKELNHKIVIDCNPRASLLFRMGILGREDPGDIFMLFEHRIVDALRLRPEMRRYTGLAAEGMMQKDIAEKLGISRASVCKILKNKSFRLEETEKEPAQAATCTDSEVRNSPNISTSDSTTEVPKCQGLPIGIKMLFEFETMIGELFGRDITITSVEGYLEKALLSFEYDGQTYEMGFRRCRDV